MKQRILQVCNTDFYLNKFLLPLVKDLVEQGFEVECLCSGDNYDSEFDKLGVKVHNFTFPQSSNPFKFLKAISEMTDFLRDHSFDCVNSHNRNASIVARVASFIAGVKVNLYTAHGFYFHDNQGIIANRILRYFEAVMALITTFTLSQSQEDVDIMSDYIPPDRMLTIGNGIKTNKFTLTKSKKEYQRQLDLSEKFRVVAVGRMVHGKGFADLINAFSIFHKLHPNSELVFVGGNIKQDINPALGEFEQLIKKNNLQNSVQITGLVNNVEDYLGASDVFVIPSYREGMPRALLEAMCTGMPVVASNIRGCREIIEDKIDGLLFEPKNIKQLSERLLWLHQHQPEAYFLGKKARYKVMNSYAEKDYVVRQTKAIQDVLQHSKVNESLAS